MGWFDVKFIKFIIDADDDFPASNDMIEDVMHVLEDYCSCGGNPNVNCNFHTITVEVEEHADDEDDDEY